MTVTPLYAGLLAIWYLVLSLRVVKGRTGPGGPSVGDGGDPRMVRLIRAHGNFAEYAPLILILLALLELSAWPHWLLHALGLSLLAGRLAHGYAFSFSQNAPAARTAGMILTFLPLAVGAVLCLWQGF